MVFNENPDLNAHRKDGVEIRSRLQPGENTERRIEPCDENNEEEPVPEPDDLSRRIARMKLYCARCGYDLTGLKSSRCPECGNAINEDSFDSVSTRPPESALYRAKGLAHWLMQHPLFFMLLFLLPAIGYVVFALIRKLIVHP